MLPPIIERVVAAIVNDRPAGWKSENPTQAQFDANGIGPVERFAVTEPRGVTESYNQGDPILISDGKGGLRRRRHDDVDSGIERQQLTR